MNNFNPCVWFEIYAEDIDRAVHFYESVFQVSLIDLCDPSDPTMVMRMFPGHHEQAGASGCITQMEGIKPGSGGTIVYFGSVDCAEEVARARQAGGTIVRDKMPIGEHGFMALIKDTEGNIIGIHSSK